MPPSIRTSPTTMPLDAEVAIVGAGPHGLAMALRLLDREPALARPGGLVVMDPSGDWLTAWNDRFRCLGIAHLRSPGVHHPGIDPHGLSAWTGNDGARSGLPYGIPCFDVFERYCAHLVRRAGLSRHVHATAAVDLDAGPSSTDVLLDDGGRLRARHVVLAVDPCRRRIPAWAQTTMSAGSTAVLHSGDLDLRTASVDGREIVIVGGGLTSGHLAVGAVAGGATVTVLARRPMSERMFDTEPGWLGPMHLAGYGRLTDPAERVRTALAARDGGSVPPWMGRRLRSMEAQGQLRFRTGAEVHDARPTGAGIELTLDDGECVRGDAVWLATGTRPHVEGHQLTRRLAGAAPASIVEGWPVLEEGSLCWPRTTVYVMGRLAMIALGPAAGNLWGARVAAGRIADAIARPRRSRRRRPGVRPEAPQIAALTRVPRWLGRHRHREPEIGEAVRRSLHSPRTRAFSASNSSGVSTPASRSSAS